MATRARVQSSAFRLPLPRVLSSAFRLPLPRVLSSAFGCHYPMSGTSQPRRASLLDLKQRGSIDSGLENENITPKRTGKSYRRPRRIRRGEKKRRRRSLVRSIWVKGTGSALEKLPWLAAAEMTIRRTDLSGRWVKDRDGKCGRALYGRPSLAAPARAPKATRSETRVQCLGIRLSRPKCPGRRRSATDKRRQPDLSARHGGGVDSGPDVLQPCGG